MMRPRVHNKQPLLIHWSYYYFYYLQEEEEEKKCWLRNNAHKVNCRHFPCYSRQCRPVRNQFMRIKLLNRFSTAAARNRKSEYGVIDRCGGKCTRHNANTRQQPTCIMYISMRTHAFSNILYFTYKHLNSNELKWLWRCLRSYSTL